MKPYNTLRTSYLTQHKSQTHHRFLYF